MDENKEWNTPGIIVLIRIRNQEGGSLRTYRPSVKTKAGETRENNTRDLKIESSCLAKGTVEEEGGKRNLNLDRRLKKNKKWRSQLRFIALPSFSTVL